VTDRCLRCGRWHDDEGPLCAACEKTSSEIKTAVEVTYQPLRGPRQRIAFSPRDDGRYTREEYIWGGDQWRFAGAEIVTDVNVDRDAGVVA